MNNENQEKNDQKRKAMFRIASEAVLFVLVLFVWHEVANVRKSLALQREAEQSPVTYEELTPDKAEYSAGDLVSFTYVRHSSIKDEALLMLTIDSFENLDTGEIFQGTIASRFVRTTETNQFRATRRLSPDCTPGTYIFEGWASIQRTIPTRPVPYSSKKFVIRAK